MLFTYYSNRLEVLASQLIAVLDQPLPAGNPLQPLTVLVQSSGMARWLSLQFARQAGVAANVRYPFVASFVWEVYRAQFPQLPKESVSDKPVLLWRLLALFEREEFRVQFPELAAYLEPSQPMLKRYQLAGMIADVFDQYLIYRPDWMVDWGSGEGSDWQARLWRMLVQAAPQDDPHRALVHRDVMARAGRLTTAQLPQRLAVIGISSLPPAYLALLNVLAQQIDVHLFVLNPSLHYWSDLESPRRIAARARIKAQYGDVDAADRGHPLLASMGRQGQEFIDLVQQFAAEETAVFIDPTAGNHCLLAALQRDVLLLQSPGKTTLTPSQDFSQDRSVQIASCHSVVRELEILHDMLLDYFARHPQAKPDDIVVMVPAIDDYAPYIQAVFGAQPQARRLPFTVSDRTPTAADALLACFLQLLDLPDRRFAHSDVIDVLRNEAVQARYGFDDFDALLELIEHSQIRWGLDESAWAFTGLDSRQNTWAFGLDRLFAGYTWGEARDDDATSIDESLCRVTPLPVSGTEAIHDIGLLSCFVRDLHTLVRLRAARTIAAWQAAIGDVIDRFFTVDDAGAVSLNRIRDALQTLGEQAGLAGFDADISYAVVRDYLEQALDSKSQGQQYFNGAITFCTLMPMRSLPFRVVCLLGLNDANFPRRMAPCSFDLMMAHPARGDRNRRHEDRYLFLEAVLAARDTLYISYLGHSIIDNSPREPSVLVSELIEMLLRYPGVKREQLICKHPLQPFDPRYFNVIESHADDNNSSKPRLFSYATDWVDAARHYQLPLAKKVAFDFSVLDARPAPAPRDIGIDDLLDWAAHPSRYLLRNRFGVELARVDEQAADEENFSIDALLRYQLAQQSIVAVGRNGSSFETALRQLRNAGVLPPGATGEVAQHRLQQSLAPFVDLVASELPRHRGVVTLDIGCGGFHLRGTVRQLGDHERFDCRFATIRGKHLLPQWISHLLLNAAGHGLSTRLVLREEVVVFGTLPVDEAQARLRDVIEVYRHSVDDIEPVFVDLFWRIAERCNKGEEAQKIHGEIDRFYNEDDSATGINSDQHDGYLFGRRPVQHERLLTLAQALFAGVHACLVRDKTAFRPGSATGVTD